MADIIQTRNDTAAIWTSTNPILAEGEFGIELDTQKIKFGDGITAWNSRPYLSVTADVAAAIAAATSKTTPVDADQFGITDSADSNILKKLTWANIKANLPSPVSLSAETNASSVLIVDLAIASTTQILVLTGTFRDITGIISGGINRKLVLLNKSGDFFNVTAEGTSSAAANRFANSTSFNDGSATEWVYSLYSSRWHKIG